MNIHEDMLIRDVLTAEPRSAAVFERFGLGCPSCLAAGMESLAAAASVHDVRLEELLNELRAIGASDTVPEGE